MKSPLFHLETAGIFCVRFRRGAGCPARCPQHPAALAGGAGGAGVGKGHGRAKGLAAQAADGAQRSHAHGDDGRFGVVVGHLGRRGQQFQHIGAADGHDGQFGQVGPGLLHPDHPLHEFSAGRRLLEIVAGTDHLYPGGVGGCDPLGQAFPGRKELDVQQVGAAGSTDGCAKGRVLVGGQGRFAALGLGAEGDEQQLLAQSSP